MKKLYTVLFALLIALKMFPAFAGEYSIEVYKSPQCGCCEKWIAHLEQNGFKVVAHNEENMSAIKSKFNIAPELQSCHTAVINGYFIEGHVPAQDIKKLLAEKPAIKGLAVPGMPSGANVPGMETSAEKLKFDVLAVDKDGTKVYARHE